MKIDKVNVDNVLLRKAFISVYKEAFGGPPYFEKYTDEEVQMGVWEPHIKDGVVVLATEGNDVVGFACALPLEVVSLEVRNFLKEKQKSGFFPIDFCWTWYNSELGVRVQDRRKGVGYALMRRRLEEIQKRGGRYYTARTAAVQSNSIHMYEKIGSTKVFGIQDVSATEQVEVNLSQSVERVYLYGRCSYAIKKIDEIVSS